MRPIQSNYPTLRPGFMDTAVFFENLFAVDVSRKDLAPGQILNCQEQEYIKEMQVYWAVLGRVIG